MKIRLVISHRCCLHGRPCVARADQARRRRRRRAAGVHAGALERGLQLPQGPGQAHRTPFDPIKYIPLNDAGDWYLSLGGQARYRYECSTTSTSAPGPQDDNGFHLHRLMATPTCTSARTSAASCRSSARWQTAATAASGRHRRERLRLPPGVRRPQAPARRRRRRSRSAAGGRTCSTARSGSSRRSTGPTPAARSTAARRRSPRRRPHTLDVFCVHPVVVDEEPDRQLQRRQHFAGRLRHDRAARRHRRRRHASSKLYALYLDNERRRRSPTAPASENATRSAARFYTNPKPWDFDVEAAYQFGDFGDGDISAWMFATEGGYTFADAPLTPRVYLGFDVASGDDDPDRRRPRDVQPALPARPRLLRLHRRRSAGRTSSTCTPASS